VDWCGGQSLVSVSVSVYYSFNIFSRKIKNTKVYIFQELDDKEKKRSLYENYPLYDRIFSTKSDNTYEYDSSLKVFLAEYSFRKNIDPEIVFSALERKSINEKEEKHERKNIGKMAAVEIKKYDTQRENDADFIGIKIGRDFFSDILWFRINNEKALKKNKKQYSYGKQCILYDRKDLIKYINILWDLVLIIGNMDFIKQNTKYINDINNKITKKKNLLCFVLEKLLKFMNENDPNKKIWYKILK
jgi:hypothetical protein